MQRVRYINILSEALTKANVKEIVLWNCNNLLL